MTKKPEWLFIGTYPNAYVYADMRKESRGDYHLIAHIYFRPLEIKIFDQSAQYADAISIARAEYEQIKANIDKPLTVSATGQTVQPYIK